MSYSHFDLKLVKPDFDSPLTDLVMELEHLRRLRLGGSTPPMVFFQLKGIFHLLESLDSARIEGNRTTVAELVEAHLDRIDHDTQPEDIREIQNMTEAMALIEDNVQEGSGISLNLIRELHQCTVDGLLREGDRTPGVFRKGPVSITGATHTPPEFAQMDSYMEELLDFINGASPSKYDLLKTALAHHRFAWIHPFNNGNGRVVRLLTYAMLIHQGFNVKQGRILNPSAVFCSDRNAYYKKLSSADSGTQRDLLDWCEYVLKGIRDELTKIDKLLDYSFLSSRIIVPAIEHAKRRELLNQTEFRILIMAAEQKSFRAGDIAPIMQGKSGLERSRMIAKLRSDQLIIPIAPHARKYTVNFLNSHLLRGVISGLAEEQFITLDGD